MKATKDERRAMRAHVCAECGAPTYEARTDTLNFRLCPSCCTHGETFKRRFINRAAQWEVLVLCAGCGCDA